jgi:hypothetical protein
MLETIGNLPILLNALLETKLDDLEGAETQAEEDAFDRTTHRLPRLDRRLGMVDTFWCVTLLKKKIPFQPGSVGGIRGDKMEHYTTKWRGNNRYCWVFTFHENVRRRGC